MTGRASVRVAGWVAADTLAVALAFAGVAWCLGNMALGADARVYAEAWQGGLYAPTATVGQA